MRVRDWMTSSAEAVTPATPLGEAREHMLRHGIRHLPVLEGDALVGIVSQRDLWPRGRDDEAVGAVMAGPVFAVGADAGVEAAAGLMQRHHVGALPVLDGGRVVGILTRGDLLGALVSALTVRSLRRPGAGASRTPASPPAALPCHDAESGFAATGAAPAAQARE